MGRVQGLAMWQDTGWRPAKVFVDVVSVRAAVVIGVCGCLTLIRLGFLLS